MSAIRWWSIIPRSSASIQAIYCLATFVMIHEVDAVTHRIDKVAAGNHTHDTAVIIHHRDRALATHHVTLIIQRLIEGGS